MKRSTILVRQYGAPATQLENIQLALAMLRQARMYCVLAKAPRAAAAVRRALKSAEGAERHAENAPYRAQRQQAKVGA